MKLTKFDIIMREISTMKNEQKNMHEDIKKVFQDINSRLSKQTKIEMENDYLKKEIKKLIEESNGNNSSD